MTQFISKTREGAKVPSREADFLQYEMGSKLPLIGGKRTIGGANVDQLRKGVEYPNVQSAIDDLYSLSEQIPINGVVTMAEDNSPSAVQQVESITFDGTVQNPDPDQTKATVHVYGFPFVFDNTTNASTVCETVYNKFTEFVNDEKYFDLVTRKGLNGEILEVRFIDAVPHPVTNTSENGISMVGTIDVQAKSGYGTWSKLGQADLPVTPAVTVYYFKRIA
ncbi:baseplate wedge subunit [Klebsiella phage iPHaGe-KPN-11i]|uniref:Baseplate wedge subunit and tail pin n=2 Tax=Pseudotevenvirus gap161 TaxID=2844034 RepID=K4F9Y2_9CAUD|nr:baseplate wedge subunit [Cronobacter phage vB_CsaM_GAP161]AFC22305.1 baseplate wedge subunit and tail pin [Cronobacter phage vB_CsaM_GAP161]QVW27337.1 baseplate wedge protein [Cronobacter phage JC03]WOL25078.1 baseplate wedge subunit [Klebsiella phage iPHaGe-KPN-12i]WOL25359.1 baseplate wedge subunit [Klebsiella phage iPHaGe-KPN-11i]